MKKFKIAILDDYQKVSTSFGDWSVIEELAEIHIFSETISDELQLTEALSTFDIICIMRERTLISASLLAGLPQLKLIVSTGPRNAAIDLEAVQKRGIEVANTGYVASGAPELTWALLMAIARKIPQENASLKNGSWQTSLGTDLKDKIIGIIGLGNIGTQIAKIAQAFGMQVIAWSDSLTKEAAEVIDVQAVSKEDLFRKADFVTVHLILSERSRGIIKMRDLSMMKPTAFLINTSRGPLIEEDDLIQVLTEKKIAGAALDVFNQEPLPADHPFRTLDNVLATPHIGYVTENTYQVFFDDTRVALRNWLFKQQ